MPAGHGDLQIPAEPCGILLWKMSSQHNARRAYGLPLWSWADRLCQCHPCVMLVRLPERTAVKTCPLHSPRPIGSGTEVDLLTSAVTGNDLAEGVCVCVSCTGSASKQCLALQRGLCPSAVGDIWLFSPCLSATGEIWNYGETVG